MLAELTESKDGAAYLLDACANGSLQNLSEFRVLCMIQMLCQETQISPETLKSLANDYFICDMQERCDKLDLQHYTKF